MNLDKFKKEFKDFISCIDQLEEGPENIYADLDNIALKMKKVISKVKSMSTNKGITDSEESKNHDALLSSINHFRRENAYYELLSFSEAVNELKRVIAESTDSHVIASAYNGLGHIYAVRGYYEEALYNFQRVIEFYPGYVDGHFNLGATYYNLDMYEEAMNEFTKVIHLDPEDSEAYRCLGFICKKLGNNEMSKYYLNEYFKFKQQALPRII